MDKAAQLTFWGLKRDCSESLHFRTDSSSCVTHLLLPHTVLTGSCIRGRKHSQWFYRPAWWFMCSNISCAAEVQSTTSALAPICSPKRSFFLEILGYSIFPNWWGWNASFCSAMGVRTGSNTVSVVIKPFCTWLKAQLAETQNKLAISEIRFYPFYNSFMFCILLLAKYSILILYSSFPLCPQILSVYFHSCVSSSACVTTNWSEWFTDPTEKLVWTFTFVL